MRRVRGRTDRITSPHVSDYTLGFAEVYFLLSRFLSARINQFNPFPSVSSLLPAEPNQEQKLAAVATKERGPD